MMILNFKTGLVFLVVAFIATTFFFPTTDAAELHVDYPLATAESTIAVDVGETFTIKYNTTAVDYASIYQVECSYDSEYLEFVKATDLLGSDLVINDKTPGLRIFLNMQIVGVSTANGIFELEFKALAKGTGVVSTNLCYLTDMTREGEIEITDEIESDTPTITTVNIGSKDDGNTGELSIDLDDGSGKCGDNVSMDLIIKNNTGIGGFIIEVSYDPDYFSISNDIVLGSEFSGVQASLEYVESGLVKIIGSNGDSVNVDSDGQLLSFEVHIEDDAPVEQYTFSIGGKVAKFTDDKGGAEYINNVEFSGGEITVNENGGAEGANSDMNIAYVIVPLVLVALLAGVWYLRSG